MLRAVVLLALLAPAAAFAQGGAPTSANHGAVITASDIQAAIAQATAKDPQRPPDTLVRMVDGGGAHVIGVIVTHRAKGGTAGGSGGTHEKVTEIFHVLEGSGTMVMDGTLVNPRRSEGGQYGPGAGGDSVEGSVSRRISKGDTIIIPPNTPHRVSEIHEDITILILMLDPEHVTTLK